MLALHSWDETRLKLWFLVSWYPPWNLKQNIQNNLNLTVNVKCIPQLDSKWEKIIQKIVQNWINRCDCWGKHNSLDTRINWIYLCHPIKLSLMTTLKVEYELIGKVKVKRRWNWKTIEQCKCYNWPYLFWTESRKSLEKGLS